MVLGFLTAALFSVFDLLKTSLFVSVPVFFIAVLAGMLHSKLSKKLEMSWVKVSFISTYLTVTLLIFFLYYAPLWLVPPDFKGVVPMEFQPSPQALLLSFASTVLALLLKALVIALLVIPLELFAALVFSWIDKRYEKLHTAVKIFAAVYATVAMVLAFILFIAPWLPLALVYFLYGGWLW